MGEIASVAITQYLESKGRHVLAYDDIRNDQYREPDPGWDLLVSKTSFDDWIQTTTDGRLKPVHAFSFSIKSSRIPKADNDDIFQAIRTRDFKIFKKSTDIALDLTADFEVQVYFPLKQSQYTADLIITAEDILRKDLDKISDSLKLLKRYGICYLSGAVARERLIAHSNKLSVEKRYWESYNAGYKKAMWHAPLTLGTSFATLM